MKVEEAIPHIIKSGALEKGTEAPLRGERQDTWEESRRIFIVCGKKENGLYHWFLKDFGEER